MKQQESAWPWRPRRSDFSRCQLTEIALLDAGHCIVDNLLRPPGSLWLFCLALRVCELVKGECALVVYAASRTDQLTNLCESPARDKHVCGDPVTRGFSQFVSYLFSKGFDTSLGYVVGWVARRTSDTLLRTGYNDKTWLVTVDDGFGEGIATVDDSPKVDV